MRTDKVTPEESETQARTESPAVRDMSKHRTTAARLKAWRSYKHRDRYKDEAGNVPPLPPRSFGTESSWTFRRTDPDDRHAPPRLYYGNGIGGEDDTPFRWKGYADEVAPRRVCHTGWYGDEHGEGFTTFRGAVFQIPGKDGKPRFMAGVEWGDSSGRTFDSGGGWIDCGRGDIYDDEDDAASAADSMAENAAEKEREYQAKETARLKEEEEEAERQEEADAAERAEFTDITGGGD